MSRPDYLSEIKQYLLENDVPDNPEATVILGSGLGGFAEKISEKTVIPYSSIPHFPSTSVVGHSGEFITGKVEGMDVIAFSGRFHHYEGYDFERTALPVYIAHSLNSSKLIISNAAGSINTNFRVGDLMVIDNVMRLNNLSAPLTSSPFRYDLGTYAEGVRKIAAEIGLVTQRGTYLFAKGPNYETKAEIRAFRIMGADAVGMSTVPELTEASRLGLKTVAVSLITNMAAGVTKAKLDHSEVKEAADSRKEDFTRLVTALIEKL